LYPKFVIDARYESSGKTVFLDSLFDSEEFSKRLLEAGADPNAIARRDGDFFETARRFDFPVGVVEEAIKRGLQVNRRNEAGVLPLDRILKGHNYEAAAALVRAGAGSDRPWDEIIVEKLVDDTCALTKNVHYFNVAENYQKHRLIIEIYRATERDKKILGKALWSLYWSGNKSMREFLLNIDEYDVMLLLPSSPSSDEEKAEPNSEEPKPEKPKCIRFRPIRV
jgi:hypothetical protein